MKPVCTCTMGHGHKTVNASRRLGWPVSVEVILSQRAHFFIDPPCLLSALPTAELLAQRWRFLSLYFLTITTEIAWCRPGQKAWSLFNSSGVKAASLPSPAMCQHHSLSATSLPVHANPLCWQIKGLKSSTQSSDPHRLWDQVHNVRDQHTQGIVPLPLSALTYDLAPLY